MKIRPADIQSFPPEEFRDTFLYAMHVSGGSVPDEIRRPSDHKIAFEDGAVYSLTDRLENRFGLAIAKRFRGDFDRMKSFMFRYWALCELMSKGHLDEYRRSCGDGTEDVNEAIFHAAASFPLTPKLKFAAKAFRAEVARIAAEEDQQK